MQTAFHFCIILTKLEFGRQILVKIHNIIFHEIHSVRKKDVPCEWRDRQTDRKKTERRRQTDRHDVTYIRFLQLFCERAKDKFRRKTIHVQTNIYRRRDVATTISNNHVIAYLNRWVKIKLHHRKYANYNLTQNAYRTVSTTNFSYNSGMYR